MDLYHSKSKVTDEICYSNVYENVHYVIWVNCSPKYMENYIQNGLSRIAKKFQIIEQYIAKMTYQDMENNGGPFFSMKINYLQDLLNMMIPEFNNCLEPKGKNWLNFYWRERFGAIRLCILDIEAYLLHHMENMCLGDYFKDIHLDEESDDEASDESIIAIAWNEK